MRAGTENVPGIVGFGKAAEMAVRSLNSREPANTALLRDRLESGICKLIPGARRNGLEQDHLPNTLNMTLPEIRGESLVLFLDRKGIAFSSGSACKSGNPAPSHALLAMGLTPNEAHCSVRFSLGTVTPGRNRLCHRGARGGAEGDPQRGPVCAVPLRSRPDQPFRFRNRLPRLQAVSPADRLRSSAAAFRSR